MTNKEVIEDLRGRLKPYIAIMSASYFSQMLAKIENGMCRQKTVEKFFEKLGYEKKTVRYTNTCETTNITSSVEVVEFCEYKE